ncbi:MULTISPECIES: M23 family metallopeptidase [unclassified Gordonia (in: high G+C Gram-positive bacteria)]|uniref:M23 family metallopeptidase n=1 Tax=unclassified Gordonia (in: high G+C Gram-positive bacteria) TaxID=2657482 RepID=UPI001FFEE0B1|nr:MULTISPECIES: M23 family metallopeptidase [unclassified Gordonia (in: high G+C Gram-positive bacteria)]UQE76621.1 M23 family metallopeptidase [Gordonia sp. PP30]
MRTTTPRALVLLWLAVLLCPPGAAARPAYDWPLVPRPPVTRGFDPPAQRWLSGHRGVDLAAAPDAAVLSAGAGVVRFAGTVAGRPTVSVLHPDGIATTYEPVRPIVRAGDRVGRGQVLGYLNAGHPGCAAAACLHWGARRGSGPSERYLNPLALVGAVRVRLKPLVPA